MLNRKKQSSFNDGVIYIYKEKIKPNDFNAKTNFKSLNDFDFITKLFYKLETKRQQDFEFAESMDRKLTLKLKTPLTNGIESNYKVFLDGYIYDIFQLDPDNNNKELYFYLERVRKIAK